MKKYYHSPKLVAIVGPTSSGKSELAVKLAKRFNGEIISADSRQVYRGMDLGTGKVAGKWRSRIFRGRKKRKYFVYKNIIHHLIDFRNPKRQYSAALFQRDAKKTITGILRRGKLPVLCGGTGHWIDAVVFNQNIPDVKPNPKLRARLEKKSAADLYQRLKKLDPRRAASIDRFNKRRLIRALEIIMATGQPVPPIFDFQFSIFNSLWLGLNQPQPILFAKIKKRLKQRLDQGMANEVRRLHNEGVSWKRLMDFGLEYKYVSLYLQKKLDKQEMFDRLFFAICHYAKRQITWWKRNADIHWVGSTDAAIKITRASFK